jgi:hypothetical protein
VRSFVVNTRPIIPLVALLLVAAWPFPVEGSASGDSRVITGEELERCWAKTPLEAVVALRPLWLSNRGVSGLFDPFGPVVTKLTGMAVYVDGIRRGGIGELQLIPMPTVQEIHRMSAEDAVLRYGADLPFGTIEVILKK